MLNKKKETRIESVGTGRFANKREDA